MSDYFDCRLKLGSDKFSCRSGRWTDHSRWHNHGTPKNGARPWMVIPGKVWGFRFDGVDDYVDCGDIALPDPIIAKAWMRYDDSGIQSGFGWDDSSNVVYYKLAIQNNRAVLAVRSAPSDYKWWHTPQVLTAENWYPIVWIQSGVDTPKIYINGISQTVSIYTQSGTLVKPVISPFAIGRFGAYNGYYFNGIITPVHIHGRARTAKEAKEDYYRSPLYLLKRGIIRR